MRADLGNQFVRFALLARCFACSFRSRFRVFCRRRRFATFGGFGGAFLLGLGLESFGCARGAGRFRRVRG